MSYERHVIDCLHFLCSLAQRLLRISLCRGHGSALLVDAFQEMFFDRGVVHVGMTSGTPLHFQGIPALQGRVVESAMTATPLGVDTTFCTPLTAIAAFSS